MKLTRILMLGLGLAVFAGAASAEPAVAQCWDCIPGPGDGSHQECWYCSADRPGAGSTDCATPYCQACVTFPGGPCFTPILVMLDGRTARPTGPEPDRLDTLAETLGTSAVAWPAASSANLVAEGESAADTRRSCDGGIISRWYSPQRAHAVRDAMGRLRL